MVAFTPSIPSCWELPNGQPTPPLDEHFDDWKDDRPGKANKVGESEWNCFPHLIWRSQSPSCLFLRDIDKSRQKKTQKFHGDLFFPWKIAWGHCFFVCDSCREKTSNRPWGLENAEFDLTKDVHGLKKWLQQRFNVGKHGNNILKKSSEYHHSDIKSLIQ